MKFKLPNVELAQRELYFKFVRKVFNKYGAEEVSEGIKQATFPLNNQEVIEVKEYTNLGERKRLEKIPVIGQLSKLIEHQDDDGIALIELEYKRNGKLKDRSVMYGEYGRTQVNHSGRKPKKVENQDRAFSLVHKGNLESYMSEFLGE